jgi:hypothetical protein
MSKFASHQAYAESIDRSNKQVVKYVPFKYGRIEVDGRAVVIACNHPDPYILPGEVVTTSRVIAYDKNSGTFETLNTIYELSDE